MGASKDRLRLDLCVEGKTKQSLQKHLLQAVKDLIDGNQNVDTLNYKYKLVELAK